MQSSPFVASYRQQGGARELFYPWPLQDTTFYNKWIGIFYMPSVTHIPKTYSTLSPALLQVLIVSVLQVIARLSTHLGRRSSRPGGTGCSCHRRASRTAGRTGHTAGAPYSRASRRRTSSDPRCSRRKPRGTRTCSSSAARGEPC